MFPTGGGGNIKQFFVWTYVHFVIISRIVFGRYWKYIVMRRLCNSQCNFEPYQVQGNFLCLGSRIWGKCICSNIKITSDSIAGWLWISLEFVPKVQNYKPLALLGRAVWDSKQSWGTNSSNFQRCYFLLFCFQIQIIPENSFISQTIDEKRVRIFVDRRQMVVNIPHLG